VSGSHLHPLPTEYRRSHDPGLHGGYRLRQTVPTQETNPDPSVQPERCDLSAGWGAVSDVQGGGHEAVTYHRGTCARAADTKEGEFVGSFSSLRKKLGCRQPNRVTGFLHSNNELYIGKLDSIILNFNSLNQGK
jgi:hypothetical protein